ncbi:MAG: helix-turn-helix transcriptional regulator [Chthoniobacter sp.]
MSKVSHQERIERELARLLKQRRESLGLSKVVTAQRAGLAVMTIFFVEELKRCPSINTLLRIAAALEVDLWQMLRDATSAAQHAKKS